MMGKRSSDVFVIGEEGLPADRDLEIEVHGAELPTVEESKGDWVPFDDEADAWQPSMSRKRPRWVRRFVVVAAAVVVAAFVISRAVVSATSAAAPTRSAGARQPLVLGAPTHLRRQSHQRHQQRAVPHRPARRRFAHRAHPVDSVSRAVSHQSKGPTPRRSLPIGSDGVTADAPEEREPAEEAAPVSAPVEAPSPEPVVVEPAPSPTPRSPSSSAPVAGGQQATGEDFGFEQ